MKILRLCSAIMASISVAACAAANTSIDGVAASAMVPLAPGSYLLVDDAGALNWYSRDAKRGALSIEQSELLDVVSVADTLYVATLLGEDYRPTLLTVDTKAQDVTVVAQAKAPNYLPEALCLDKNLYNASAMSGLFFGNLISWALLTTIAGRYNTWPLGV